MLRKASAVNARSVRWLAALAATAAAPPLAAQLPDSTRRDTAQVTLPPLTVNASRETRDLMQIPLAATRVDPRAWAGAKGQGLDEALQAVPGVVAQSRAGWTDIRLTIRGFGARGAGDRSNAGTSRGIRVLLDGVPETEPDGRTAFDNIDLASIQGIEVVRSNATVLWGSAAGGVVSLSTLPTDPNEVALEASAGGFGLRRAVLRASARLGEGVIGGSLVRALWDGWRDHSEADRWLATGSALTLVGGTQLGVYATAADNFYRIPGPLTEAQADSAPWMANPTYAARDERRWNRQGRLAATLEHPLGARTTIGGMVFVMPKVLQRSERGTYRDFNRYHVGANAVLRAHGALSPRVRYELLTGADEAYQDGSILFYSLTPDGGRGDTLRTDKREGGNNLGVFVMAELELDERLGVEVGARWDAITYFYQDFLDPALDDQRTFSGLTPKLGVRWTLGPAHVVYANVGGGIEAPAGNETDPAGTFGQDTVTGLNPLLDAIRSTTIEVGTRRTIVGSGVLHAVRYDVALYTTGVRNEIVPYRGGRFYFTAGETRRTGIELGLMLQGPAGLQLDNALTLSRGTYQSYVVDSVHYGVPGAAADYSGNDIVGLAPATWSVRFGWAPPGRVPLALRLSAQGSSSYYADDANAVEVPGYHVAAVGLDLSRPVALGARLALRGSVSVNNVFDRSYIASAFLNPDVVNGEPVAFEPGLPRHVVVSLSLARR